MLVVAQHLAHLLDRLAEQMRDVVERRVAVLASHAVRLEVAQRAQHDVELLDHVRGQPHRARLVHDGALDRLPDPPRRVGREAEAALGIEFLERVNEAEVAFLDQVGERQAAVEVVLGDADHQAQVVLDHLLSRVEVAAARGARVAELLFRRTEAGLPDLVQVDLGDVVEEVGADADLAARRAAARACACRARARQRVGVSAVLGVLSVP